MPEVDYSILGPLAVRLEPDAVAVELRETHRMLLGRFLLAPGTVLSASTLADDVWGEDRELKRRSNSVQVAIGQLRQRLNDSGPAWRVINTVGAGYRLVVNDAMRLDAERFRALAGRGKALSESQPRVARAMLQEALACWRGPVLGDHGRLHWAIGHATELEILRNRAETDFNDVRLLLHEYDGLESTLRRQIHEHPADERRRAQLIRALDGAGRTAEAGLAYRDAVRDLGALGAELRRLGERIGRGQRADDTRISTVVHAPFDGALLCARLGPTRDPAGPRLGTTALLVDRWGGAAHVVGDDELVAWFEDPGAAIHAADALVADERLRPAIAVHAGPLVRLGDLIAGAGPSRARLLAEAAHPGQVLVSEEARARCKTGRPLRNLGAQRFADLLPGEPLYEFGGAQSEPFPAPETLDVGLHNLPVQQTTFVGRRRALTDISRLLSLGQLVTVLGAGGCGKTRLALQVAANRLPFFHDGAWFVELGQLETGADVETLAIAAGGQLGVRPLPDELASSALVRHLSDRALLLVLDNCEHALAGCVELVSQIRRSCPRVCVLATSRQPLRLAGERVVELPAMDLTHASPDALPEAVQLLLERSGPLAGDARATVHAATRICRAVEGSPLGIELAAGLVATRGLVNVADDLDTQVLGDRVPDFSDPARPPRQRTIEATIRWSHELLDARARRVLHRLAVFRGSFALAEAQAVAGGDDEVGHVFDALIERSMLTAERAVAGEPRMRLGQPIRAFALARATDDEVERVRRRHAEAFRDLVTRIAPRLFGPDEQIALERLEADHDNFRAALAWMIEDGDVDGALTLVGGLWWLWFSHGHFEEGAGWTQQVLAMDERPSQRRVRALRAGSHLSWWRGDYAQTRAYNHALEACARELGDEWGLAWAALGVGAAQMFPDPEGSLPRFEESRSRFQRLGRDWEAAYAQQLVAASHWFRGDERAAGRAYLQAADEFERLEHGSVLASVRRGAGLMAARCGQLGRGEALCEAALRFTDAIGDRAGSAQALNFLAAISRGAGEFTSALERYAEALKHAREVGELWATCSALDGIAGAAQRREENELAARLLACSGRLAERSGYRPSVADRQLREQDLARVREALDSRDFDRALAEGELMSVGEAVASALAFAERAV
ncbi:putative ATPase [Solirubrobacter pauli]|uniref:Putative ATPase n=1 Tax=Solirubrobacter pauli TaxID=166793 RepID=A0A660LIE5_9ACTN|nr:BTAD domain-containing putative transcriptional regulator [Solirubrobacter pauli]RKQ93820.1 putative ATPase [Solirubrobacter pauli]